MASEPANSGPHDEVKAVIIRTFGDYAAAQLAAANLEAHGVPCWINSDDAGGMLPNLTAPGGVRLLVRASDVEAAIALLDTQASAEELKQMETESITPPPPETVSLTKPAWGQILFGIVIGVILCLLFQWANDLGTKTYYHYAANGKHDEEWIYRNGHLVEYLEDRNGDGVWDHWAYHEHGRLVRSENDNNFDGKPDEWWTFSDGGMDTVQKDRDFNGIPDEFCTYKYRIIQQVEIKPNGSTFATQRWIYQNGVLVEILRGGDSNGNFKEVVKYDPFFNPISTNIPTAFQLLLPSSK